MTKRKLLLAIAITIIALAMILLIIMMAEHQPQTVPDKTEIDFQQSAKDALLIRAKNDTSTGWSVNATNWVDISTIKNDLAIFLSFGPSDMSVRADDIIGHVEITKPDKETVRFDIVCRGKGPLMIMYDGKLYIRRGAYKPIRDDIFTSESLELTSMIDDVSNGDAPSESTMRRMRRSAGFE